MTGTTTWTAPAVRALPPVLDRPVLLAAGDDDLLDAPAAHDLAGHLRRYGPGPSDADGLLAAVEAAGITGHGGGHVAVAAKWRRALAAGGTPLVVANGSESEPASAKDGVLLRLRPHLVLDGLVLTARALGAGAAVVRVHEDSPALGALAAALRERGAAGLGGPGIEVVAGPGGYVAGESSAVLRGLAGGPALPAGRAAAGHAGDAARGVVHNVETLARVALAARGAGAGGGLVTVVDGERRTVLDTAPADTVADALAAASAGDGVVLVGGHAGTWLAPGAAATMRLWAPGAPTGAGVLSLLAAGACPLAETARLMGLLAGWSAGQCGPCRFGLPSLAELTAGLAAGRLGRRGLDRLRSQAGQVRGRGACHHPDGAVRLLASALDVFAGDVEEHVGGRGCLHRDDRRDAHDRRGGWGRR